MYFYKNFEFLLEIIKLKILISCKLKIKNIGLLKCCKIFELKIKDKQNRKSGLIKI